MGPHVRSAATLVCLLLVPVARGQQTKESPRPAAAEIDRQLADVEKQLEELTREVRALRRQLQQPAPGDFQIIPLKNADVVEVAQLLGNVYRENKGVRIVAEPVTNALLIAAGEAQVADIRKLVEALDRPKR
jgi:type II secretory pathway component GspD/PulD (secretin)